MLANKHAKIMLVLVFAVLGFMLATQIKTTERQKTINVQRAEELTERLRVVVNALTRMRFCTADGVMEFASKEGAGAAPAGFMPWFEVPGRASADVCVAFGHWSTLGHISRPNLLALDTGCIWGGCLSAMRVDGGRRELLQIDCHDLPGSLQPF